MLRCLTIKSSVCCLLSMQAVAREVVEAATDSGAEVYDVYVHDAQPLAAGEEKHMLSVFVADEKGLINRVAGVFGRRGNFPVTNGMPHVFLLQN